MPTREDELNELLSNIRSKISTQIWHVSGGDRQEDVDRLKELIEQRTKYEVELAVLKLHQRS